MRCFSDLAVNLLLTPQIVPWRQTVGFDIPSPLPQHPAAQAALFQTACAMKAKRPSESGFSALSAVLALRANGGVNLHSLRLPLFVGRRLPRHKRLTFPMASTPRDAVSLHRNHGVCQAPARTLSACPLCSNKRPSENPKLGFQTAFCVRRTGFTYRRSSARRRLRGRSR